MICYVDVSRETGQVTHVLAKAGVVDGGMTTRDRPFDCHNGAPLLEMVTVLSGEVVVDLHISDVLLSAVHDHQSPGE
jgi:hypothetical protein